MRAFFILSALLCVLALNACTMIPAYERPDLPVPDAWPLIPNGMVGGVTTDVPGDTENTGWREFFEDETLRLLIETALANNRDLGIALLNIEKAGAMYRIQRADLLPAVSVSGSSSNQRISEDTSTLGESYIARQQSVSVGFTSFELDLFGRLRSLKESALQRYFATEEAARSTQLSLVAEVAAAYLRLTADKEILALARSSYENRKEVYDLVVKQFEFGIASDLAVQQARTGLEDARVMTAQYKTIVGQDENALALLLGAPIPTDAALAERLAEIKGLRDLAPGMPSDLLLRRPDIMGSEYQLLAANANIGAARANFFPRIGITSNLATITPEWDNLFTGPAASWLFAPAAVLPIFDMGRNMANLSVSESDRDIAVLQYEKTVQTAFREVADTLVQRANIGEQLDGQTALVAASKAGYDLSLVRYTAGIDDFLAVLDAQRTYTAAQQGLIAAKLLREVNALTLYKALGGGWK